jgi:hypothetical protein
VKPIRLSDITAGKTKGLDGLPRALGRLPPGTMNQTEREYADLLEWERRGGVLAWFGFELLHLKLAPATFLIPDFLVMRADGRLQVHEVKGHWTDDALAKTKIAASLFPFEFFIVRKRLKRDGGGFSIESVDHGVRQ